MNIFVNSQPCAFVLTYNSAQRGQADLEKWRLFQRGKSEGLFLSLCIRLILQTNLYLF